VFYRLKNSSIAVSTANKQSKEGGHELFDVSRLSFLKKGWIFSLTISSIIGGWMKRQDNNYLTKFQKSQGKCFLSIYQVIKYLATRLGLFISKSIIEAHGCRIWSYNNGEGKGATFSFTCHYGSI
jgi:hypothetical protein